MKTVLAPAHFIVARSTAANFNSSVQTVMQSDIVGIELIYSGSPTGVIHVQTSLNYNPVTGTGDWANLYMSVNGTTSDTITLPTATSPIFIDMTLGSYPVLRIQYIGSGAGTIDGYMTYKRVGD